MQGLLTLGPDDMEPWIGRIEKYIAPDFAIGDRLARRLTLEDLHIICGEKTTYSLEDAQSLYKRQWRKTRYTSEMDMHGGYTLGRMLDILRLRARYLNARGATLNNPHIPKRFFTAFRDRIVDVRTVAPGKLQAAVLTNLRLSALTDPSLRTGHPD